MALRRVVPVLFLAWLVACEPVPITGRSQLMLLPEGTHAARDLWQRMDAASRAGSRPPEFLSTHPSPVTRIRQIEG